MASSLDDLELIRLVKTFPILYMKPTTRSYKNATLKDAAWKKISMKLNASERACITRWKSIRDRFGREFRRIQEQAVEPTMCWEMFPHLIFLKDHYKHGQAKCESLETLKYEPKEPRRKQRFGNDAASVVKKFDDPALADDAPWEDIEINHNLIALVKEFPVLYDSQKIRNSNNITAKHDAWREIAQSLDMPEEVVYKRWKKLRDRFAREYRNHQIDSEAPINFIYFTELMFLEGHYRKGIPLIIENLKRRGRPPKNSAAATVNIGDTVNVQQIVDIVQDEDGVYVDDDGMDVEENVDNDILDGNAWGTEYPFTTDEDDNIDDAVNDMDNTIQPEQQQQHQLEVLQNNTINEETQYTTLAQHIVAIGDVNDVVQDNNYIEVKSSNLDNIILIPNATDLTSTSAATQQTTLTQFVAAPPAPVKIINEDVTTATTAEPVELLNNVITNMECVLRQSQDCLKTLREQQQQQQIELQAAVSSAVSVYQPQTSLLAKTQMLLDNLSAEQRTQAERKIIKFLCECQIKELNYEEIDNITSVHFT